MVTDGRFDHRMVFLLDARIRKDVLALQQDELFWRLAVQYFEPGIVEQSSFDFLRPQFLVLQALGIEDLTQEIIRGFLSEAQLLYRQLLRGERVRDLRQAALVALALREWGSRSDWRDVLNSLSVNAAEAWETVLACLYAMNQSPQELFDAVVSLRSRCAVVWGIHLFVLYQMDAKVLSNAIKTRSLTEQLMWLRQLVAKGHRGLAIQLAAEIVDEHLAEWNAPRQNVVFQNSMQWQYVAELCVLAERPALALEFFTRAGNLLKSQRAEMDLRQAGFWLKNRDRTQALGVVREALQLMPEFEDSCQLEFLFEEKADSSIEGLKRRFEHWQDCYRKWQQLPGLMLCVDWTLQWKDWLTVLLQNGLLVEAQTCARVLLAQDALTGEVYEQVGRLFEQQGDLKDAIVCQQAALAAEPSPAIRRRLADLLETTGEWHAALSEREKVYQQLGVVDGQDAAALARCALRAGDVERAWDVCQQWLEVRSDDGLANGLAGMALARLGKLDEALRCLELATNVMPKQVDFWLEMAEVLKQQGATEQAADVLRVALSVLPDEIALQLALGRIEWSAGRYADALPVLQQVWQSGDIDPELAIVLADVQDHLGLKDEALQTIQQARCMYPHHPELAARHAELLALMGDVAGALAAFTVAIEAEDAQVEWLRSYVRCALVDGGQMEQADQVLDALQRLLHEVPSDFEGRFLLGKVLLQQNEIQNAYAVFSQLVDDQALMGSPFAGEVWHELGRTALMLNLADAAVTAFQEATQLLPKNQHLLRELAEAYEAAGMDQEAVQLARQVCTDADDVGKAVWFARLLLRVGDVDGAVGVWERIAANIESEVDLLLEMANALRKANRVQQAWEIVQKICLDAVSPNLLRRMAALCYALGQTERAFDCLSRSFRQQSKPLGLQALELAYLCGAMKQWGEALPFVEVVLRQEIPMMDAWVWAADVLAIAGRWQAALKVLEQALALTTQNSVLEQIDESDAGLAQQLFVFSHCLGVERADVLFRLARLTALQGNYRKALEFALSGVQVRPENMMMRYLAAELAAAQAQMQFAMKLVEPALELEDTLPLEQQGLAVACLTLCGELALREGDVTVAEQCLQKGRRYGNESARLLALKSRLYARQGKFWMANDVFDLAIVLAKKNGENKPSLDENWLSLRALLHDWSERTFFVWVGEALLDLQRWKEAFQFLDKAGERWEAYAGVWLVYLIAAVRVEEARWLYDNVHLDGRLPVVSVEPALKKLSGTNIEEVQKWIMRANVIFEPLGRLEEFSTNQVKDFEDAQAAFAAWLKSKNWQRAAEVGSAFTEDAWARLMVGFCQVMMGEVSGLIVVQEAAQVLPFQPLVQGILAGVAERCQEWGVALDAIDKALQIWPGQAEWYAWAAKLAKQLERTEDALSYWEQAIQLAPQSVEYKLAYAAVCRLTGRSTLAIRILREAAALNSDHFAVWFDLALTYQQNGDWSSALTCAERVCMLAPDCVDGLILAGQISLQMGRLDDALRYASDAIRYNPNSKQGLMLLVDVWMQRGQPLEALNVLEQANGLCRQEEELGRRRAALVAMVQGKEAGFWAYRQVSLDFPESASALIDVVWALIDLGQLDEAMRTAQQVLRLDPARTDMLLFLGRSFRQQGQLDQAVHFFSEAVLRAPQALEAQLELGQTYQQQRQYSLALEAFERAMQIAPQDYRAFHLAGLAKRDAKDYPGAEAMLRRAVQLAPSEVGIRRQLAAVIALNMVQTVREVE